MLPVEARFKGGCPFSATPPSPTAVSVPARAPCKEDARRAALFCSNNRQKSETMGRKKKRGRERQTDRQAGRQTGRQADRQKKKKKKKKKNKNKNKKNKNKNKKNKNKKKKKQGGERKAGGGLLVSAFISRFCVTCQGCALFTT